MSTKLKEPVFTNILNERHQGHETRKSLYNDIEVELKRPLLSFITSFNFPASIESEDADMIEDILQKLDLKNGIALMVNSPGGDGLSAERIINTCKSHSGTGEFTVIVPGKAKSAATMICLGASKIYMSKTSELGPIDPQIRIKKGEQILFLAVHNIIKSYEELLKMANETTGNLDPYLLQLSNYDAREIEEFRREMELSKEVAIRALRDGMMKGKTNDEIEKKIKMFLTPEETKSHGRSIFSAEAAACGLIVEEIDLKSTLWEKSYELYVRCSQHASNRVSKFIETKEFSFAAGIQ